jgi:hypothetical protein
MSVFQSTTQQNPHFSRTLAMVAQNLNRGLLCSSHAMKILMINCHSSNWKIQKPTEPRFPRLYPTTKISLTSWGWRYIVVGSRVMLHAPQGIVVGTQAAVEVVYTLQ